MSISSVWVEALTPTISACGHLATGGQGASGGWWREPVAVAETQVEVAADEQGHFSAEVGVVAADGVPGAAGALALDAVLSGPDSTGGVVAGDEGGDALVEVGRDDGRRAGLRGHVVPGDPLSCARGTGIVVRAPLLGVPDAGGCVEAHGPAGLRVNGPMPGVVVAGGQDALRRQRVVGDGTG